LSFGQRVPLPANQSPTAERLFWDNLMLWKKP